MFGFFKTILTRWKNFTKEEIGLECEESLQLGFTSKGFEEEYAITKAAAQLSPFTSTWKTSKSILKTDHLDEQAQKGWVTSENNENIKKLEGIPECIPPPAVRQ